MIKPNTLCMIRGVPQHTTGHDCNGKIVETKERFGVLWRFEPELITQWIDHQGIRITTTVDTSESKYLYPLDDCADELASEALDEVLERTFRETLQRELERL